LAHNDPTFEVTIPSARGLVRFLFGNRSNLDFIASLIRANGLASYEVPTPAIFVSLVQEYPGLVLDVGAKTGLFALLGAAANPMSRVYACEPLESARELLCANMACNPDLAARIAVAPFGLSRAHGSFPFFETINNQGLVSTSSSLELDFARQIGEYRNNTIVTQTLDGWAETFDQTPIQLIKIDVEGHEHAVIAGGRKAIGRHRPFIIIEILGAAEVGTINDLLTEENYLDIALAPDVLRHCLQARFHGDAWNHLLCPAEKASRIFSLCRQLNLRMEFG